MLRQARPGDEDAIEAFLADHAETSMFLLSNLRDFGLAGDCDDPRTTTYWLAGDPIIAVFGLSKAGFGMCQAPDASDNLWRAFAEAIAGQTLAGFTGEAGQIEQAKQMFGLTEDMLALNQPEPLYRLSLDDLIILQGPGELHTPDANDHALLAQWAFDYDVEALGTAPGPELRVQAEGEAGRMIEGGRTRVLVVSGETVAKTTFNARLPDMVQIGGVYTPPALRARGYARKVVALHLAEARAEGVKTAILFASGPAACRAYEAIGFQHIGSYALAILKEPVVIGA